MQLSTEAIYQGLFVGRLGKKQGKLRTGRWCDAGNAGVWRL